MSAVKTAPSSPVTSGRAKPTAASQAPVRRKSTLLLMWAGLAGVVLAMCIATVIKTHGTLTYIIDDAYIHLTMARNFAQYHTWGMVPGEFESSSSSPGWVMFLGFFVKVVPAFAEWWPLVINLVCCFGILAVFAYKQDFVVIRKWSALSIAGALILPSVLFLPGLVQLGMEHSLHTSLVLLMLLQFERMTEGDITPRRLAFYGALLLATTAIRMETAFLALAMGLVLVFPVVRRAWRREFSSLASSHVAAFVVSGIVPAAVIGAIGAIDLSHGQYFMPNSVVEKTELLGSSPFTALTPQLSVLWRNLSSDWFFVGVMIAGAVAIARNVKLKQVWIAWMIASVLHATYAQFGWYDRYQAYLLISGILLLLRSIYEMGILGIPVRRFAFGLLLFVLLPMISKYQSIWLGPQSAFQQFALQNQTGRFMAEYYNDQTIMINDIGHVTWQHRGGLVDMWALGSFEVLKSQHDGYYNSGYASTLAREHHVAVVAESSPSFDFFVPRGWVKAAQWEVDQKADKREQYIAFWAPDEAAAERLRANMRAFMATMPTNSFTIPSIVG